MSESQDNKAGKFLAGLLMGIGAGISGYIFLTKTELGKKIRKRIGKRIGEYADQAEELLEDVQKKGEDLVEKVNEIPGEVSDVAKKKGKIIKKFFVSKGKLLKRKR